MLEGKKKRRKAKGKEMGSTTDSWTEHITHYFYLYLLGKIRTQERTGGGPWRLGLRSRSKNASSDSQDRRTDLIARKSVQVIINVYLVDKIRSISASISYGVVKLKGKE